MCGITGWVAFGRDLRTERPSLEAMTETMACRGPDDRGHLDRRPRRARAPAARRHRRGGRRQPMSVESPATVARLQRRDVQLPRAAPGAGRAATGSYTDCDTEVVLHAYLEWGAAWSSGSTACSPSRSGTRRDREAAAGPRPDGHQAALLLPDAATACCSAPSPRRSWPTRSFSAPVDVDGLRELFAVRQDPGPRHLRRHARGRARHRAYRRPRRAAPTAPTGAARPRSTPTTSTPPSRTYASCSTTSSTASWSPTCRCARCCPAAWTPAR